ncbi:Quinone oxidoreductase [Hypsibius exemplaris]|uniref:Quinone oxidoreductase n=1 Tax=Hypsibius exemplaris TaxID=2072580 RepID=A0A1W0X0P3_HYPEX|nr:Quinone oxidoreductase [Hypsibius exemplaris]
MAEHHRHMKAVLFDKPGHADVLRIDPHVPIPKPGPGQLLVRVHAVGLNKVEVFIREGMIPFPGPVILGTDGAGVVEEVTHGVSDFRKGDRVAIYSRAPSMTGTYAEYFVASPDMLFHLPENMTFHQGAGLGTPFMTAYSNIVIHGAVKFGDIVLINGASGGVGLFAIEIANALGCKVIGVAGHETGLSLISQKGAIAISYKDPDFVKKVKVAAGPKGVDFILETTAKNVPKDIEILGKFGRVCLIGAPSHETVDFDMVLMKELTIKGTQATSVTPEQYRIMKAGLDKALEEGSINPIVEKVYTIDQIAQAHNDLMAPRSTAGKLILDLS